MSVTDIRRETSGRVIHPDVLLVGADALADRLTRVEAPYLNLLYAGDPANGWEGDPRLCMYQGPEQRYYLVRLEADEQYRVVCRSKPYGLGMMDVEGIQRLIRELIAKDSHRGVDVGEETIAHNQHLNEAQTRTFNEAIDEEIAPRLDYWRSHAYLPGIDLKPRLR